MRVVFIQYGFGGVELAEMMVASCLKFNYEVWQLSDEKAPRVPGIDKLIRSPKTEGRMLFRARMLTEIEPPYVMLDTDMIVAKDISDGFGVDAAVTWRDKHNVYCNRETFTTRMPYNGGVLFASNAGFVMDCYDNLRSLPPNRQDWYGDQIALRDVVESGKYQVREHRDPIWNFCPDSAGHDIPNVKIYHFKGVRKHNMPAKFKQLYG